VAAKRDPVEQIDLQLLKLACPENSAAELIQWIEPIKAASRRFGIDTVREVGCFLGQGGHESEGFRRLEENLSYRAERLTEVWPKRFPTLVSAQPYARNPERLANKVYADRMGNGNEASGDGWRHRGGGIFQLTGKRNQQAFASYMRMPLANVPAFIRTKDGAALSAGWFWLENNLDRYAATAGVEDETQIINGGQEGLADRRNRTNGLINELLRRGC
jgi:putative chitinase